MSHDPLIPTDTLPWGTLTWVKRTLPFSSEVACLTHWHHTSYTSWLPVVEIHTNPLVLGHYYLQRTSVNARCTSGLKVWGFPVKSGWIFIKIHSNCLFFNALFGFVKNLKTKQWTSQNKSGTLMGNNRVKFPIDFNAELLSTYMEDLFVFPHLWNLTPWAHCSLYSLQRGWL